MQTACCITGGGPAGMMLGYLLARNGIDVVVLEKHADFLRDFRGDTIHPSTLQLMHELGLLEEFLKHPHQRTYKLQGSFAGYPITLADFSHVSTICKFIAFMPQWDFLNFISEKARAYPHFKLIMQGEVKELIEEGGRVVGVKAETPDGPLDIRAILTVGADGRHSLVRQKAGLKIIDVGAPIDVLWMRISRLKTDPEQLLGRIETGKMVALIDRHDYWQCAYVIPKGAAEKIMSEGIESLRAALSELVPFFGDRVQELKDWNDVKLLTVSVNYLEQWFKRGLLCIGDAAHAMSPVGGVGINLAIQDAVATANILSEPLHAGRVRQTDLRLVQGRRMWPTMMTQRMQIFVQKNIILRAVGKTTRPELPFVMKLMNWFPVLQRIPAHFIGVGFRPEHINPTLR